MIEKADKKQPANQNRRKFIKTTGGTAAALLLGGIIQTEHAQARSVEKVRGGNVGSVMEQAMATGNMPAALAKHGRGLDPKVQSALGRITREELMTLRSVQNKLPSKSGMAGR